MVENGRISKFTVKKKDSIIPYLMILGLTFIYWLVTAVHLIYQNKFVSMLCLFMNTIILGYSLGYFNIELIFKSIDKFITRLK